MKRVGAIGRLMASIALLAAGFSLCRAWAAPWESVREHPSDEMARAFLIILPAAGLALVLPGWPGRSLGRFAAAGALISVSCWLAPDPIREAILARVLIPIDRRFSARKSRGPTQLEVCLLKTGYASNIAIVPPKLRGYRSRPPARPGTFSRRSMVELGIREAEPELTIVQMALALAVALADATSLAVRRRRSTTSPPPMRPELP